MSNNNTNSENTNSKEDLIGPSENPEDRLIFTITRVKKNHQIE
jgi:hypothetical protein